MQIVSENILLYDVFQRSASLREGRDMTSVCLTESVYYFYCRVPLDWLLNSPSHRNQFFPVFRKNVQFSSDTLNQAEADLDRWNVTLTRRTPSEPLDLAFFTHGMHLDFQSLRMFGTEIIDTEFIILVYFTWVFLKTPWSNLHFSKVEDHDWADWNEQRAHQTIK
jgi:hypothetical protein